MDLLDSNMKGISAAFAHNNAYTIPQAVAIRSGHLTKRRHSRGAAPIFVALKAMDKALTRRLGHDGQPAFCVRLGPRVDLEAPRETLVS